MGVVRGGVTTKGTYKPDLWPESMQNDGCKKEKGSKCQGGGCDRVRYGFVNSYHKAESLFTVVNFSL